MRDFLKVLAVVVMVPCVLVFAFGALEVGMGSTSEKVEGFTIVGAAVITVLLSGSVWLLSDIAQAVNRQH